ncbi:sigma-70 family RNA polymerase sigma factor [Rathayibacter soli]|uniref:sigma-70 family RNA polymerase sigma factor n=1 Tax=Rathayibacter soli TaxID=3144168 RepID=UPI0027E3EE9E|nr:sigma-70 family RNA polymerase sigma factor [Glaciibacter superstes]
MTEHDWLAEQFEQHRPRLTAVSYRILGSRVEAEDAVQDTWLRLNRAGADDVENLGGWLTTVVSRVCLNMLRARRARPELLADFHIPEPVISRADACDPEDEALLADSVSRALQIVLDTLAPAERLAFVMHDIFDVPFEGIAPLVARTPAATRQLASRARRRVKGADVQTPDVDRSAQRKVVAAFFTAARAGDFEGLIAVLHPDVVLRSDGGNLRPDASQVLRGIAAVTSRATMFSRTDAVVHPALVNGSTGVVVTVDGRPVSVMCFLVINGKILEIQSLIDPERLKRLDLAVLE